MQQQLKDYRKRLGMTQAQFAEVVGYGRDKTIADYETGQRAIPKFLIELILKDVNPLTSSRVELQKVYNHISHTITVLEADRDHKKLPELEGKETEELLKALYVGYDALQNLSFFPHPEMK